MSNSPSLHLDVLFVGQQTVLPAQYCTASGAAAFGGISLLAGPIFCGTPTPVQFTASAATAIVNVVPSLSVPGGNALNISADGLGTLPYPGNGLAVNALQHVITCNLTSGITMNPASITVLTPTYNFFANEIHVGTVSQSGAKTETGAKADAGARVEASIAAQNANVTVAGTLTAAEVVNAITTLSATYSLAASKKGFDIKHPSKEDYRLRYICLEGPSAEVYLRGKLIKSNVIELPEYWKDLVDSETIGVTLTPHNYYQELFVEKIEWGSRIVIKNNSGASINCSYVVYGERKDLSKNIPEYKGLTPSDYPGDNTEYVINGL